MKAPILGLTRGDLLRSRIRMFSGSYSGARVLVTGDTGFKGAWLSLWLKKLGAEVYGLALPPTSKVNIFSGARIGDHIHHIDGDITDLPTVKSALAIARPDIIFHLAAQSLVRESYRSPLETMMTNVVGTAHLCEALRQYESACAMVVVTTDKCYENREWVHGYRENDAMGGSDPYSASKGAAELVTASWRASFLPSRMVSEHRKPIATARAGNVIGPGDWAADRIVPDAIRALRAGEPVMVRNPASVRPWQHVLEPLSGYLALGEMLMSSRAAEYAEAWNFGPLPGNVRYVRELVEELLTVWGEGSWTQAVDAGAVHEAKTLRLSIDKAVAQLKWRPVWEFGQTVRRTAEGYRAMGARMDDPAGMKSIVESEIQKYMSDASTAGCPWVD